MICRERRQSWFFFKIQSYEDSFVRDKHVVAVIAWPRFKF